MRQGNLLSDPRARRGRRNVQFYKHTVTAGLTDPQLQALMADEHRNTPNESVPLNIFDAADIDEITFDELGCHMEPHECVGACQMGC